MKGILMDYLNIYNLIIGNAKLQKLERIDKKNSGKEYYEIHHIIPKSSGGLDTEDNLAVLTAREHFICHWILYKINPSKENAFSWWMLSNNSGNEFHIGRSKQSSRKYEYARKAFSKHIGDIHRGKFLSDDHKIKLSETKMGKNNPMFGKKHSEEHKAYLSEINLGEKNHFYGKTHTSEARKKISDAKKLLVGDKHPHYGKDYMKQETKEKFSEMYKGKPRLIPHEIVQCAHCKKQGIKPNMKRWHFDNCKNKETNINE